MPATRNRWFALQRLEFLLALLVVGAIWHGISIVAANKTLVPSPLLVIDAYAFGSRSRRVASA